MTVYYRLAALSRPSQISTTFGLVTWLVVNVCSCSRVVQGQPACCMYSVLHLLRGIPEYDGLYRRWDDAWERVQNPFQRLQSIGKI